jgi:hypothetical protein
MFPMIVELAVTISSQGINSGELTYQMTLFPAPAIKGKQSQRKRKGLENWHFP